MGRRSARDRPTGPTPWIRPRAPPARMRRRRRESTPPRRKSPRSHGPRSTSRTTRGRRRWRRCGGRRRSWTRARCAASPSPTTGTPRMRSSSATGATCRCTCPATACERSRTASGCASGATTAWTSARRGSGSLGSARCAHSRAARSPSWTRRRLGTWRGNPRGPTRTSRAPSACPRCSSCGIRRANRR